MMASWFLALAVGGAVVFFGYGQQRYINFVARAVIAVVVLVSFVARRVASDGLNGKVSYDTYGVLSTVALAVVALAVVVAVVVTIVLVVTVVFVVPNRSIRNMNLRCRYLVGDVVDNSCWGGWFRLVNNFLNIFLNVFRNDLVNAVNFVDNRVYFFNSGLLYWGSCFLFGVVFYFCYVVTGIVNHFGRSGWLWCRR